MTDDVDGQKKVALIELPEISSHACDLAGGACEEDASTGTDCISNPSVHLFPDRALHVFGTHDGIETGFVADEHVADRAAPFIEGGTADYTAFRKHLASKEPENTARRGPIQKL